MDTVFQFPQKSQIKLSCLALLLLSNQALASVDEHAGQSADPAPRWDFIEFETKGRGPPITSWRLTPDSGGSWTEIKREDGAAYDDYKLVWYEIEPTSFNYDQVVQILSRLPMPAPDFNICENFMPDMVYGTLRLTKAATTTEIAWNSGCLDEGYRDFLNILQDADQLVADWGKKGTVLREEKPG